MLGYISETSKFGTEDLPVCRQFTLEEIVQATKNFDKTAILGESSLYGTVSFMTSLVFSPSSILILRLCL